MGLTATAADGTGSLGTIRGISRVDAKSIGAGNYTFTSLGGGTVCDAGTGATTLP